MAGSNSALSYQMMWEEKLSSAMINAEMRGAIQTACEYAKTLLKFVGVKQTDIPQKPLTQNKDSRELHKLWTDYYFDLLEVLGERISATLAEVRVKYRTKNMDIPAVSKT